MDVVWGLLQAIFSEEISEGNVNGARDVTRFNSWRKVVVLKKEGGRVEKTHTHTR